jgi:hypothetical protein
MNAEMIASAVRYSDRMDRDEARDRTGLSAQRVRELMAGSYPEPQLDKSRLRHPTLVEPPPVADLRRALTLLKSSRDCRDGTRKTVIGWLVQAIVAAESGARCIGLTRWAKDANADPKACLTMWSRYRHGKT